MRILGSTWYCLALAVLPLAPAGFSQTTNDGTTVASLRRQLLVTRSLLALEREQHAQLKDSGASADDKLLATVTPGHLAHAHHQYSVPVSDPPFPPFYQMAAATTGGRDKDCPPCFNCLLPNYHCSNFANCSQFTGRCECPAGFGGEDCAEPVCGSLADGSDRMVREGDSCQCSEGWGGINCNVCQTDKFCNALMPEGINGTCYKGGLVVHENFQMCNVTNTKIIDMLPNEPPQVTFSCHRDSATCSFQFWIKELESFSCQLHDCAFSEERTYHNNQTLYQCNQVQCECMAGRKLCGEDGSIDITDFLKEEIQGPASFECNSGQGCRFEEPAMNDLIRMVFGDSYITLQCDSGECLHYSEVPGFERPIKPSNVLLIIVSVGAGIAFVVAVGFGLFYLAKARPGFGSGYMALPSDHVDDERDKLMAQHVHTTLSFQGIGYGINGQVLLDGVTGIAKPGQVMAVMGASGAGKTTFLDILARRNKPGRVGGEVLVNGQTVGDTEFKRVVGFVDQEDTLMPTLTVYETILYSALLRLPRGMSHAAKRARVIDTMRELDIMHIKDSRIGSTTARGISGGEKRRVSIACELVTSPSILFLDEPTSGLDAYNAYNVIECLVHLARTYHRTIVFTIHQPRSNIFALFDQLVLLAEGRMVYSGSARHCQTYFEQVGHPCPPGFNIADFVVDLTKYALKTSNNRADAAAMPTNTNPTPTDAAPLVVRPPGLDATATGHTESNELSSLLRPRLGRKRSIGEAQADALYSPHTNRTVTGLGSAHITDRTHGKDPSTDDSSRDVSPRRGFNAQVFTRPTEDGAIPDVYDEPLAYSDSHLATLVAEFGQSTAHHAMEDALAQLQQPPSPELSAGAATSDHHSTSSGHALSGTLSLTAPQRSSWGTQFVILADRTFKNLYRDPLLLLSHYLVSVFLAVLCGLLFYQVTDDISGFQNRMGVFFFMCSLFGFSCLTSLQTFATERVLFMRERANGYYAPITYFAAKVIFDIFPLRVIPPLLLGSIVYPMVGLVGTFGHFTRFLLVLVLFNLAAASICLCVGIVCRQLSVANLLSSLVMLFSMLFGGLLLNKESIPYYLRFLKDLSIFNYALESMIVNEMKYLQLRETKFGLEIDVPGATILSTFGFNAMNYWPDVTKLGGMFLVFVVVAFVCLQALVKEKR
ncbi:(ABC) transporter [Dimargaris verticillata]|uniref:(ABC) transporter n=1 Tax=Dimargaris verticillata TaxID=2761393 RepID=A0A9W8E992_9FUNG|nr:(ABC) transporter [Dimargaris verticillata]